MKKTTRKAGWGVTPHYSDLTDEEREDLKIVASWTGKPAGVLIGDAVRAVYGEKMRLARETRERAENL